MPTLLTIPFSHFCEKARWSLDHAGVDFREEGHVPGLHRAAVKRARGAGSVPVLVLDDGRVLDDSPLIVRWADAQAPEERKILPAAGPDRDEALALERRLDLDFAPHVRRLAYFHLLSDQARTRALMGVRTPRWERSLLRVGFPLLRTLMRRSMRIDDRGAARSREKVRGIFDEVGRRLADGRRYLLGDRLGVADIAFASFSAVIVRPAEHPFYAAPSLAPSPAMQQEVEALIDTAAARFAVRLYRDHRRRQGAESAASAADDGRTVSRLRAN